MLKHVKALNILISSALPNIYLLPDQVGPERMEKESEENTHER